MALLLVMIITSSLQLRGLLIGTPKPILVSLQLAPHHGLPNHSLVLLAPEASSVIRLQELPIELLMLMPSDTQVSVQASTQHPT
jgi:hypothetical protein